VTVAAIVEVPMRGLFRRGLALAALGMALIGCSKSNDSDSGEAGWNEVKAPHEVTFLVPGMS
jgi:hypothetical protein